MSKFNVATVPKSGNLLRQILNQLMDSANISISQLCQNTGLAHTTIKRMCTDPECNPTLASIEKIAFFFNITPDQLLGLKGLPGGMVNYRPNFKHWEKVPIIDMPSVLNWPGNLESIKESNDTKYITTDIEINEQCFAILLHDESLEPKFSLGTVLIFDPLKQCKNKNFVLIHQQSKSLPQIRQVLFDGPDAYIKPVHFISQDNSPKLLDECTTRILGVLIQARSNFI